MAVNLLTTSIIGSVTKLGNPLSGRSILLLNSSRRIIQKTYSSDFGTFELTLPDNDEIYIVQLYNNGKVSEFRVNLKKKYPYIDANIELENIKIQEEETEIGFLSLYEPSGEIVQALALVPTKVSEKPSKNITTLPSSSLLHRKTRSNFANMSRQFQI